MNEGRRQSPGFATRHPVVTFALLAFSLSWVVGSIAMVVLQQVLPTSVRGMAALPLKYEPSMAGLAMAAIASWHWRRRVVTAARDRVMSVSENTILRNKAAAEATKAAKSPTA